MHLVVISSFGVHSRGDAITAAADVADVLVNHGEKVVRVSGPVPAAAPEPDATAGQDAEPGPALETAA